MKASVVVLDLLWFVLGPMLVVGGLLNFEGDRLLSNEGYSAVFYTYTGEVIFCVVLGVGLIATGTVLRRLAKESALLERAGT